MCIEEMPNSIIQLFDILFVNKVLGELILPVDGDSILFCCQIIVIGDLLRRIILVHSSLLLIITWYQRASLLSLLQMVKYNLYSWEGNVIITNYEWLLYIVVYHRCNAYS